MRKLRFFERLAWTLGFLLLAIYATVRVHGEWMKRGELSRFAEARAGAVMAAVDGRLARLPARLPADQGLWSDERITAYEASLEHGPGPPLAVLRIPSIGLAVPVLDGTDDWTLNRAVGRIPGTARIGEPGNIGIAGHRDGFFRGLKDVGRGTEIVLDTLDGTERSVGAETSIVDPDAVGVLAPTAMQSITLVTCYPFYFVGSAPQRYIVRAVRSVPGGLSGT